MHLAALPVDPQAEMVTPPEPVEGPKEFRQGAIEADGEWPSETAVPAEGGESREVAVAEVIAAKYRGDSVCLGAA